MEDSPVNQHAPAMYPCHVARQMTRPVHEASCFWGVEALSFVSDFSCRGVFPFTNIPDFRLALQSPAVGYVAPAVVYTTSVKPVRDPVPARRAPNLQKQAKPQKTRVSFEVSLRSERRAARSAELVLTDVCRPALLASAPSALCTYIIWDK